MTSSRPTTRRAAGREAPIRQVPPPPGSREGGVSYTRFIPREELQGFAAWTPGSFGEDLGLRPAGRPERTAPADGAVPMAAFDAAGGEPHDGPDLADDEGPCNDSSFGADAVAALAAEAEARAAQAEAERLEALHADLSREFEQRLAEETAAAAQAARHQGYQDGYRDGLVALDSFKESHARQLSGQIGLLLQAMDGELQAMEQQLAASVARVATEIARQVVRSELAIRPALVAQVAQEAIGAVLQSARHISVLVNPDDHALVAQGCSELLAARGARLAASATIARGGCRIESDAGSIDACVAARWAQATQSLGTGVAWSDDDAPGGDA